MNIDEIRSEYPALGSKVYGRDLIYLDNAATTQRPLSVIKSFEESSLRFNANIHRAVHSLSVEATEKFEQVREQVRAFINAEHSSQIIFTSGTTASINLLAYSFGEAFISSGDEIIISEEEHHSNIVPWQLMCKRKGSKIVVLPVDDEGHLRVDLLPSLISSRTKIVCICHVSNVLGIVNPVKDIVSICHGKGIPVLVDGSQGIAHQKVDIQDIGCDFYAFSGHKIFATTGVGILYGSKQYLEQMPPFMGGGEMIRSVSFENTTYAPIPYKFEAGTQNISGVYTLTSAISALVDQYNSERRLDDITAYLLDEFTRDKRIHLYGVPRGTEQKIPLFSITVQGAHHEDLATLLDKMGVAVRSGQMCAEPLMTRFGVTGMLRSSFAYYNTLEEAELFVKYLRKAIDICS